MPDAKTVAQYIIAFFQKAGDPVSNLKLQKLLYYVQGWHLGLHGKPAFEGSFQAWVHGPVNPDVYHQYKAFRWNPINEEVATPTSISSELTRHIDEVLDVYGVDSGWELERRTHLEAPWIDARRGLPPDAESTEVISNESMAQFFKQQAAA